MGVHDLWKLLAPCGHRVSIDTLASSRLAVDASIWLVQFLKAMRDPTGAPVPHAHLVGLIRRLLRLLFHGIRPVFVFDGPAPKLKKQTIAARRRQREAYGESIKRMAEKILLSQLKMRSVQQLRKKLAERANGETNSQKEGDAKPTSKRRKKGAPATAALPAGDATAGTSASNAIDVDDEPADLPVAAAVEDDSIEWEADEAEVKAGPAAGASHVVKQDDDDELDPSIPPDLPEGSSEDEDADPDAHLVLPADGRIDPQVLARLPISLQYQVMQQQREHNRFHNFHRFTSAEHDPEAFSHLQMAGFLKSVQFSQSIDRMREEMNLTVGPGGMPLGSSSSGTAQDGSKLVMEAGRPASGAFVFYKSTGGDARTPFSWRDSIKNKKTRDAFEKRQRKMKRDKMAERYGVAPDEHEGDDGDDDNAMDATIAVSETQFVDAKLDADWLCAHCSAVNKGLAKLVTTAAKRTCQTCGVKREDDDDEEEELASQAPRPHQRHTGPSTFHTALTTTLASAMTVRKEVRRTAHSMLRTKDQWQSPADRFSGVTPSPPPPLPPTRPPPPPSTVRATTTVPTSVAEVERQFKHTPHVDVKPSHDDMPALESAASVAAASAPMHPADAVDVDTIGLACTACTFFNPLSVRECRMCHQALPAASTPPTTSLPLKSSADRPLKPISGGDLQSAVERATPTYAKLVDERATNVDLTSDDPPLPSQRAVDPTNAPSTLDISFEATTTTAASDEFAHLFAAALTHPGTNARPAATSTRNVPTNIRTRPSVPVNVPPASGDLLDAAFLEVSDGEEDALAQVAASEQAASRDAARARAAAEEEEQIRRAMELSLKEAVPHETRNAAITFKPPTHAQHASVSEVTNLADSPGADHVHENELDDIVWLDEEEDAQATSAPDRVAPSQPIPPLAPPPPLEADDGPTAMEMCSDDDDSTPPRRRVKLEPVEDAKQTTSPIPPPPPTPTPAAAAAIPPTRAPASSPYFSPPPAVPAPVVSPHFPPPATSPLHDTAVLTAALPEDDEETRRDRAELKRLIIEIEEIDEEVAETRAVNGEEPDDSDQEEHEEPEVQKTNDDGATTSTAIPPPAAPSAAVPAVAAAASAVAATDGLILPFGLTVKSSPAAAPQSQAHLAFLESQRQKRLLESAAARRVEDESNHASLASSLPDAAAAPVASAADRMVYEAFPSHLSAHEAVSLAHSFDSSYLDAHDASQKQANAARGEAHVTEEMLVETKEMLRLFGIPYIESPGEAEAQCATLESIGLVDGVITDDSDIFLFGAQRVYRHFFESRKYCQKYVMEEVTTKIGVDRRKLIHWAMLLGSDYTPGVKGIGIVNATEILNAFPGEHGLEQLRDWIYSDEADSEPSLPTYPSPCADEERARLDREYRLASFKYAHRNIKRSWAVSRDTFPSREVIDAYWHPNVDDADRAFTWAQPDWDGITKMCREHLQWTAEEASAQLLPVQRAMDASRQVALDRFFSPDDTFAVIASDRLSRAVKGLVHQTLTEEEVQHQSTTQAKKAAQAEKRKQAAAERKRKKNGTAADAPAADTAAAAAATETSLFDDDFDLTAADEDMLRVIEQSEASRPEAVVDLAKTDNNPAALSSATGVATARRRSTKSKSKSTTRMASPSSASEDEYRPARTKAPARKKAASRRGAGVPATAAADQA